MQHLKAQHSQCVASDDVVTRAREQYRLGQCQLCRTFAALNADGSVRAHGPVSYTHLTLPTKAEV